MPFYRFHIDTPLPADVAVERIRALTGDPPPFLETFRELLLDDDDPPSREGPGRGDRRRRGRGSETHPFLGSVQGHTFRLRRDLRGMNSFLPMVWGDVHPGFSGARVSVTMFLHPLVAAFMLPWLTFVGLAAWRTAGKAQDPWAPAPLVGMFVFGVALTLGAFITEAIKARRILEDILRGA